MQDIYQRNGAPRGYGQQRGNSIFLDNPGAPQSRDQRARLREFTNNQMQQQDQLQQQAQQGDNPADIVQSAYTALLGRPAESNQAILSHLGDGRAMNREGAMNAIRSIAGSPEAQAYRDSQRAGVMDAARGESRASEANQALSSLPAQDFSRMRGYDASNWNNGMNSAKYNAGHILSRYQASPNGLRQAVSSEEFQKAFPGAKLVEGGAGDKIDFGNFFDEHSGTNVGVIDVGRAFDPNNPDAETDWGWDLEGLAQGGGNAGMPQMQTSSALSFNDSPIAQALLRGGDNSQLQALLEQLMSTYAR